jgi:hypothetical protein
MRSPHLGLHTKKERSNALEAANKMLAAVTKGDRYDQLVAYGYFMAIRDLAHDEGHPELADKMEEFMERVQR